MRPIPLLLLGSLLAGPAWSVPQGPDSRPAQEAAVDIDADFEALMAEYDEAMEAFYAAYDALPEDAGPEDFPVYPGESFYPRFRVLADAGQLDARFWCFENMPFDRRGDFVGELETLLAAAPADERLGGLFSMLHWSVDGASPELLAVLDDFSAKTPRADLALAARCAKGMVLAGDESDAAAVERGIGILDEVVASEVDFPGKRGATGKLYSLRNLGIGMVAPEWTGKDIDGEPIALSDYRGKVTVFEFWGFW
ncbi:MAG: hypothetical protein P1V81_04010 [Planctomycetota bacterium]|nr:hypothetical protein [Planctomycetota bacterium]